MTDEEIISRFREADALLAKYREILEPVLSELAEKKSMVVFGKPGMYRGEFGCWEQGCDTICLHLKDSGHEPPNSHLAYEFEHEWNQKISTERVTIFGFW